MKKKGDSVFTTRASVDKFELIFPMIKSDLFEIRELSKKKQDESLNTYKVQTINKKLSKIKEFLNSEPSSEYLDLLDDALLPTNSDAVLLISQYVNALHQFKEKYFRKNDEGFGFTEYWQTTD